MNLSSADTLQNWIPHKLFFADQEPLCHWLYIGDKSFEEPFFADTIGACYQFPVNSKFIKTVSTVDILPEWSTTINSVEPAAFIFHISRCGSTLLSQLLAMDPGHIVLSEVPFFDELLRMHYQWPGTSFETTDKWLQAAIKFYGQKRRGDERHLFIKADCWHIFFYERLRKLYPGTPFILLYRSPDEVLQSQQKRRGMQAVPGIVQPELMGLTLEKDDAAFTDLDIYFSKVMEKLLEVFMQVAQKDERSLLVNYREGMLPVVKKMAAFAEVNLSPVMLQQMEERSQYHGKYPGQPFAKEASAGSPGFLKKCREYYYQLEEKRKLTYSSVL